MGVAEHRALVEGYFAALERNDVRAALGIVHDDVVIQINGRTPISGRFEAKSGAFADLMRHVDEKLVADQLVLARAWQILCADDDAVVAVMQGGGPTVDGRVYDQTNCMIFVFRDDRVATLYEFMDTVMIEHAIFANDLAAPRAPVPNPMTFPPDAFMKSHDGPVDAARVAANREAVESFFRRLQAHDMGALDLLHDDIELQLLGSTPGSGRWVGKQAAFGEVAAQIFAKLIPEQAVLPARWRVMCADERAVVAIMTGGGPTVDGRHYENTYCMVFTFRDDRVGMLYEFHDTAMIEHAIFTNDLERPETALANPLTF